jgi:hypothetical protein
MSDVSNTSETNRSALIKNFVDEMEDRMKTIEIANDDLKMLAKSAKDQDFDADEVAAMKQVAKLRLKGNGAKAKAKLEKLQQVSEAAEFDLFSFAGA